jgi:hypothetical protein
MSALNYAIAWLFLGRGLRFSPLAAAAGAYLFAFASSRMNQIGHPQLWAQGYTLVALYALARLFGAGRPERPAARLGWWLTAALALAAQHYAAFYLGAFAVMGLAVGLVAAVSLRGCRARLFEVARVDAAWIALAGVAGLAAMTPFLAHYLPASRELGPRWWMGVRWSLPAVASWWHVGPNHVLYGVTAGRGPFAHFTGEWEQRLGLGLVAPLACGLGLWLGRSRPVVALAGATAAALIVLTTILPVPLEWLRGGAATVATAGGVVLCRATRPAARARGLALLAVVALAWIDRDRDGFVDVMTLAASGLCVAELLRGRDGPSGRRAAAVALTALVLRTIDATVLMIGGGLSALGLAAAALLRWGDARRRSVAGVVTGLAFAAIVTQMEEPWTIAAAAAALGTALAAPASDPGRAAPGRAAAAVVAAVIVLLAFDGTDALWHWVYYKVPGGSALRAVGRVALVVLVPAAIGLAALLARAGFSRRPWAAGLLVAACVAEQAVRTSTTDGSAEAARVAALARRVDPAHDAFYHHPGPGPLVPEAYHLDAMWAALEADVPTINGYSGGFPRGWDALYQVDFPHGVPPDEALREWLDRRGVPAERVQAILDESEAKAPPARLVPRHPDTRATER